MEKNIDKKFFITLAILTAICFLSFLTYFTNISYQKNSASLAALASANTLKVVSAAGKPGTSGNIISIDLSNALAVRGLQFIITDAPNVLTAKQIKTTSRTTGFTIAFNDQGDKGILVSLYSVSKAAISAGQGPILQISYDISSQASGQINLQLFTVKVADAYKKALSTSSSNGVLTISTSECIGKSCGAACGTDKVCDHNQTCINKESIANGQSCGCDAVCQSKNCDDCYGAPGSCSWSCKVSGITLSAAAASATQVNLSWNSYPNASTYQIYKNNSWFWWTAANTTSASDTKCSANSTYAYRVDAYDAASKYLASSNEVTVTTPSTVVTPPITYGISGNVKKSSGSNLSGIFINLSGAQSSSATTDSSGNFSFTNLPKGNYTLTPSNSSYIFCPASRNINLAGSSSSMNFTAIASSDPTVPANLRIIKTTNTSLTWQWNVSAGAAKYDISMYKGADCNMSYQGAGQTATSKEFTSLQAGTMYSARVRACKSDGTTCSAYSCCLNAQTSFGN